MAKQITALCYPAMAYQSGTIARQRRLLIGYAEGKDWSWQFPADFGVKIPTQKISTVKDLIANLEGIRSIDEFEILLATNAASIAVDFESFAEVVEYLRSNKIHLALLQDEVDTTNPSFRGFLDLAPHFAQLERNLRAAKIATGIATARESGKQIGRPKLNEKKRSVILDDLTNKRGSIRKLAAKHKVGVSTVQRLKEELPK